MDLQKEHEETNEDQLLFPYEINDIDPVLNAELLQKFQGERSSGFIQVGPKKWLFPKTFADDAKFYYNFKSRPDDVFVTSFPRSGTTWTQEMVWLLSNNLDYDKAQEIPLLGRYAFLELSSITGTTADSASLLGKDIPIGWKVLNQQSHAQRRFIKTHLSFELLPPDLLQSGPKIVYVARNPKDMIVSYYHFVKSNPFHGFTGNFADFWALMRQNLVYWAPYWEHVKQAWNRRNDNDNFMFIFYEDLQKDLKGMLSKLATFLGRSYTKEQLDRLVQHLEIDNFKKNKSVDVFSTFTTKVEDTVNNKFVRKGKVGDWKECFDEELEREADDWIAENLKETDIKFPINLLSGLFYNSNNF